MDDRTGEARRGLQASLVGNSVHRRGSPLEKKNTKKAREAEKKLRKKRVRDNKTEKKS